MIEQWQAAVDCVVRQQLEELRWNSPPVDAIQAVRQLGIEIALDSSQSTRARQKSLGGQKLLLLKPDDRPERLQWAAAHELGEISAWKIFREADMPGSEAPPGLREQVANLFATRFLLPERWFRNHAIAFDGDLLELKDLYRTASHELIARRLLDLFPERILTIIDQGQVTSRGNGFGQRFSQLIPVERKCWKSVNETGTSCAIATAGVEIRGWPIHEPGWKREILWTNIAEDYEPEEIDVEELVC